MPHAMAEKRLNNIKMIFIQVRIRIHYFIKLLYTFADFPKINEIRNRTIKIKNRIFAIEAAPAAIPPNPNTAAIIAIIRNVTVQRNISYDLSI